MYEPKIGVVRANPMGCRYWNPEDGKWFDMERAYLVRGLPMPGERVITTDSRVCTVDGLADPVVVLADGSVGDVRFLRPHDPEAERLRVATEAVKTRAGQWWVLSTSETEAEDIARAVLDAIKEVDDG